MDLSKLRRTDLNLLVAFVALVEERSVTAAARRLALSQPATSAALGRLRELFDDPLLVRDGRRMRLTARAEALREPIATQLSRLAASLAAPEPFDPARSDRTFRLLLADFACELLLSRLAERLAREAPRAGLHVRTAYPDRVEELDGSSFDLWVLSAQLRNPTDPHAIVFEDGWVVVGCRSHHASGDALLRWRDLRKLRFAIGNEELERRLGAPPPDSRQFRHRVPAALVYDRWDTHMLRGTPWVRAVPACLATRLERSQGLVTLGRLGSTPHQLALQWPQEKDADPGLRWLRSLLT
ncbi:MAG: LysR family transcriptional regulator, partial [Proteobacteria bacterium]|nr:LysR family transcriptional regulator [Pseudomonadota bacterium]